MSTQLERIHQRGFRVLQMHNPATATVGTGDDAISFACLIDEGPMLTKDMQPEGYDPQATAMLYVDGEVFEDSGAELDVNGRVTVNAVEWTVTGKGVKSDKVEFALSREE